MLLHSILGPKIFFIPVENLKSSPQRKPVGRMPLHYIGGERFQSGITEMLKAGPKKEITTHRYLAKDYILIRKDSLVII